MPPFTFERAFCSINHPNGGPGESDLEDPNDVEHSAELARKMRVLKLRADAREGLTKIDMEKIMASITTMRCLNFSKMMYMYTARTACQPVEHGTGKSTRNYRF